MKKRFFSILGIVSITVLTLISCNVNEEVKDKQTGQVKDEISLNDGACIYEDSKGYSILDFEDNSYNEIESNLIIRNFNKDSGKYLYIKDSKYYIHSKSNDIELEDTNVQAAEFSPNGEYLFYFTKENNLKPEIYDIKNNKKVDLKIKCSISGTYATWLDNNRLAYYGVDTNNKISGLFTYDLKSNDERLEYNTAGGYISFVKSLNNSLAFFEEKYTGERSLKLLNTDGTISEISDNILEIYDLQTVNNNFYLLGRMNDNVYSLYDLSNNKRLIFDFPSVVNFEAGLSVTESGEVLFVGNNDGSRNDKIYAYSNDNVYILNNQSGSYTFININ